MAIKQNKQPPRAATPEPADIVTIGLDIGYGHVKLVSPTAAAPIIFPSIWGHPVTDKSGTDDLRERYPGDLITDNGHDYFVGFLAQGQLKEAQQFKLRGRTANESENGNIIRARFAKAAIGKLYSGLTDGSIVHIRIATGLPVDHMADAPELRKALIGQHAIVTDAANFVANVTEVIIMPQPLGTIYANSLTPDGELNPCHVAKRTGVIDVGTFSIDMLLDDDGEMISAESGSVEGGVHIAQERIKQYISDAFKATATPAMVDTALLTQCIRIKGVVHNIADAVEDAYEPIRSATIAKAGELWQGAAFVDVIYLSGGGASIVAKALAEAGFSQAVSVDNPQTANARGYLNYALWLGRD